MLSHRTDDSSRPPINNLNLDSPVTTEFIDDRSIGNLNRPVALVQLITPVRRAKGNTADDLASLADFNCQMSVTRAHFSRRLIKANVLAHQRWAWVACAERFKHLNLSY